MSSSKVNKLYLYTAQFPYGKSSEAFLETEISFLARHFCEVEIIPCSKSADIRDLPKNVFVNKCLLNLDVSKKQKKKVFLNHFFMVISIVFSEIKSRGFIHFWKAKKTYFDHLSIQLIRYGELKKQRFQFQGLHYDYWFANTTLALTILKKKKYISKLICRAHGFDVYDDRILKTGVPFRVWKLNYVDKLYCVSENGLNYIKNKTPQKFHSKLSLARLGVQENVVVNKTDSSQKKLVVSCARLIPIKRIPLIPEVLSKIKTPIHWVHFGNGQENDTLNKTLDAVENEFFTFELKGDVSNDKILNFYKKSYVDFFISLSASEGLPVSMMEAQSFGIPIVSTDVGGISEIIKHEETGILLSSNSEPENITKTIEKALKIDFDRFAIHSFFQRNYSAQVNYLKFIAEITSQEFTK